MRGLSGKYANYKFKKTRKSKFYFNIVKTCPLPCENNRDCVQCKVFGTGNKKLKADCDLCDIELEPVERIEADPNNKMCQFNDLSDNCTFLFSYDILNDKRIRYQASKDCPSTFPTWAIILIIVSGVLFLGFSMLIVWKILDTMQQKRECARFNEEKKRAAWETVSFLYFSTFLEKNTINLFYSLFSLKSENPLYKSATSKFVNPSYKDTKIN
jgi:protocadherin alpha